MNAPEEPRQPEPVARAVQSAPVCDRSGDAGSRHVWAEGATVGDWCLCGKRKRFPPFPEQERTAWDDAYDRAEQSDEWERRGGGGL